MSLPFAGKRASIKSRPSRSGSGEGSGLADGSLARHSLLACVNLGQTDRSSPLPEYSQCKSSMQIHSSPLVSSRPPAAVRLSAPPFDLATLTLPAILFSRTAKLA